MTSIPSSVHLPLARGQAGMRGLMWGLPALLLGAASVGIYSGLRFAPSGISSRLVDFSIAVIASPIPLTGLFCFLRAARWLALAFWPGSLGITAAPAELVFRLGPFGSRRYDAARLNVQYPFEMDAEAVESTFEAYLPEEQQMEQFLPHLSHPEAPEPLHRTIFRFAKGSEAELAKTLRPMIDLWRTP
jgi:hypothetical protein